MRRAYLFAVTAFCMFIISYVIVNDMKGAVPSNAIIASFGTIASCCASYVFTASWQDVRVNQTQHEYRARDWRQAARGRVDSPDEEGL